MVRGHTVMGESKGNTYVRTCLLTLLLKGEIVGGGIQKADMLHSLQVLEKRLK